MNKTKLLYRLTVAGSGLLLATTAVLSLVDGALPTQIALLGLGIFGGLVSSHLRLRMMLSGQRNSQRAIFAALQQLGVGRSSVEASPDPTKHLTAVTLDAIRTGLGDTQAAVAASESFLLAEMTTLRQRLLALGTTLQATEGSATLHEAFDEHARLNDLQHRSVQGQFQQLRVQIEQLPSDAGEYATVRRLLIPDETPMPQLGGWAISSSTIDSLVHKTLAEDGPHTIVELGSGASTLWLAHALRSRGTGGHIHSLDHLEEYAEKTRALLDAHGLSKYATIHIAPLVPLELDGMAFNWYELDSLPPQILVDMLLVDGPPAGTSEHTRYPALPQFADRLTDGALVYLDDTIRADEKQVVERWLSEFPALSRETQLPKSTILRWNTDQ